MQRITLIILICLFPILLSAGEIRTTPENIVLTEPTTNRIELMYIKFNYSSTGSHWVQISYNVIDSNGEIRSKERVNIYNRPDNPTTDDSLCLAENDPWNCCTGLGTGDCDETLTDFTDFIQGYGSTLATRTDAEVWSDIQSRFTTQP